MNISVNSLTSSGWKLVFGLFVILAILKPVSPLRCWVCSSHAGGLCSDPFNTTDMWQSDCPKERPPTPDPYYGVFRHQPERYPVCKKVKQKENGRLVIIRSCGHESRKNGSCDPDGDRTFSDDVRFCDTCTTDGCNSAPLLPPLGLWISLCNVVLVYASF